MARILMLANNDVGLYKFRKELIEELLKDNKVFISLPNGPFIKEFIDLGCRFIDTNISRRGTNPITDLKLILKYSIIIKQVKPDIVLTYTIKPNVYGGLVCRMTKTPYFPNITGLGDAIENESPIQRIALQLYKTGLKNAKCVFFQNKPNKQFFIEKGIIKSDTKVIPGSGVNLEQHQFEDYPEDAEIIRFLYIGRIMKAKGIDELLEAAIKIKQIYSNVEFDLVGFCEDGYLEKLKEFNETGIIHYLGQQNDVHKFIKMSHATILPSYHEGISNALLESASTGRPILASKVTGCKETFDEGISGLGFERKNVDTLVNTIINFIELPYEKKKEMGLAGRRKMEQEYDRRIVIDAYLEQIKRQRGTEHEFVQ